MKLRAMHVRPDGVNRVWDIILMDDRTNARIHMNPEGTEFMDIVILDKFDEAVPPGTPRLGPARRADDQFASEDDLKLHKTAESSDTLEIDAIKRLQVTGHDIPF